MTNPLSDLTLSVAQRLSTVVSNLGRSDAIPKNPSAASEPSLFPNVYRLRRTQIADQSVFEQLDSARAEMTAKKHCSYCSAVGTPVRNLSGARLVKGMSTSPAATPPSSPPRERGNETE